MSLRNINYRRIVGISGPSDRKTPLDRSQTILETSRQDFSRRKATEKLTGRSPCPILVDARVWQILGALERVDVNQLMELTSWLTNLYKKVRLDFT